MKKHQSEIHTDDALGSAMRAFVDHSRAKGICQEEITFVLISTAIAAALDRAPSYAETLVTATRAVTCAANIFADKPTLIDAGFDSSKA
jgi:folate-dependent phosphoribosylglycinamide formyltransferase PurN